MVNTLLPSTNFDSNPGLDELKFQHQVYSEEFRLRSEINSLSGVVDFTGDPGKAPFTSGRPLLVTISPVNPLTIDIAAGQAITPLYTSINIDAAVPSVPLPDISAGKTYIVAVEYVLIPSQQQRFSRFGVLVEVRDERPANVPPGGGSSTLINAITVADINDFNNPTLFSSDRKDNLVVIGVVTVLQDPTTGQLSLSVDSTRTTYAFNRPWYTALDVQHRSYIGSGVVSSTNPHGTELQDLSSAGLTLYQQYKPRGTVVAKDSTYYGYPGVFCTEIISANRIEYDRDGSITTPPGAPQQLGGRYYIQLTKIPVRPGSLYIAGKPWVPVPYEWVRGTRLIVLGPLEVPANYSDNLIYEYFSVDALSLDVSAYSLQAGLQNLTVKNPITGQLIVSQGLAIKELSQTTVSLSSLLSPIKKKYQVLCDGTGSLQVAPQPIVTSLLVSALVGGVAQTVNQAVFGAVGVKLIVGLTRAVKRTVVGNAVYDLNVKLRITGLDSSGAALQENINFKASQWEEQFSSQNVEQPLQFIRTKNAFALVQSVQLTNTSTDPHNSGPDSRLSIWADILDSSANQELANVASFFWTGVTGVNVRDERLIATTLDRVDQKDYRFPLENPENDFSFVQELFNSILTPPLTNPATTAKRLAKELDDDRYLAETWKDYSGGVDASGQVQLVDFSLVTPGLTLRIAEGKVLKVLAPGVLPEPGKGEVAFGTSGIIFVNNLITAINDPAFDSTWSAALGSGSNPPVVLTRAQSYPEGFVANVRKTITFTGDFVAGDFTVTINGTTIGPISFNLSNDQTLTDLLTAINLQTSVTGVSAAFVGTASPHRVLVLNGPVDGQDFTVTPFNSGTNAVGTSSGGAPTGTLGTPLAALTLTQPTGGILPTDHLPARYPSQLNPWSYLTRPLLWEGVILEGSISLFGNSPALISNFDQIQIAPTKILTAKRGLAVSVDPTAGEFLVDPASLLNTLSSMVATINHPMFNSGVNARLDPLQQTVILRISGYALASLRIIVEGVPSTWSLSAYVPTGPGDVLAHALVKTIHPLYSAEWRFQTVDTAGSWSPWLPMTMLSPTAWRFDGPPGPSLYQVQLRMTGEGAEANGFSLYQFTPEVSGATLGTLDTRVTDLEGEVHTARGSLADIDTRISAVVDASGAPVKDPELIAARASAITADSFTLKERLDNSDSLLYWISGGTDNTLKPTAMLQPGLSSQILSGPVDGDGNAKFFNTSASQLQIGGTSLSPLVFSLAGYSYVYSRQVSLDFSALSSGTYYIKAEVTAGQEAGLLIASGTCSSSINVGTDVLTDSAANFALSGVLPGHVVIFPGILVHGQPFYSPVISVPGGTQLQIAGSFPAIPTGTPYQVRSPRELLLTAETSKLPGPGKLYLGQVQWTGAAFSGVYNYRYQNKYTSALITVTAGPNYGPVTFAHQLGFVPSNFSIYANELPGGDITPKVLNLGDEAIVQADALNLSVKNRYSNLVFRRWSDGTSLTTGTLQLVIN